MGTPAQKIQMSATLKERLKHSGRYHRSPINSAKKNPSASTFTGDVFTTASMLSKMSKELNTGPTDCHSYSKPPNSVNESPTKTSPTTNISQTVKPIKMSQQGNLDEDTISASPSDCIDHDNILRNQVTGLLTSVASISPLPFQEISVSPIEVDNKISQSSTCSSLQQVPSTPDSHSGSVLEHTNRGLTMSPSPVLGEDNQKTEMVLSFDGERSKSDPDSIMSPIESEMIMYVDSERNMSPIKAILPHTDSKPTRLSNILTPVTSKLTQHCKEKYDALSNSSQDSLNTPRTSCNRDISDTFPLSGDSVADAKHIKDEIGRLRASVEAREETLRELKLVKMYREKNNLKKLETSIERWRHASQTAVEELQLLIPESCISQLVEQQTFEQHLT